MNVPPNGDTAKKLGAYFETLKVTQQPNPNMTVKISEGAYWGSTGATFIEFPGGNSPAFTAPAVNTARWVLVTLTGLGVITLTNGTATTNNPPVPLVPTGHLPLAWVYVTGSTTSLTDTQIFDARPTWVAGAGQLPNHNDLPNRSVATAHPISAISDLQSALDNRPTFTDLNNGLNAKADDDGSTETSFKLNSDEIGVPASNVQYGVERGTLPDVFLRWNEATDIWEFTNNGSTWYPIATPADIAVAAAGSFVELAGDTMTGILDMGNHKVTNVAAPTVGGDAVNKTYVDTTLASSYQPLNANLSGLSALVAGTGLIVETVDNVFTNRTITGTAGEIVVVDGNGVGGNPTLSLPDVGIAVSSSFVKITTDDQGRVSGTTAVTTGDITPLVAGTYVDVAGDTMTGALVHPVGTAALPSITFTGDLNTGIYWSASDEVSIAVGGVKKATVSTSGITVFSGFFAPGTGGAAAPEFTFTGDTDTGMYHPAANQVGIAAAGVQQLLITSTAATFAGNLVVTGTFSAPAGAAGNLDMNSFKVVDMGPGTGAGDAVEYAQLNTALALRVAKAGDSMTGVLAMGANKITGLASGTVSGDALHFGQIGTQVQAWDADLDAVAAGTYVGAASITTLGTITTGVWNGTDVAVADGGTGASTATAAATNLGLGTGDSPQFTAVNVGHVSDTTVSRFAAGDIAVEGNVVYRAGGTDVAVADGGTGVSTTPTNGQLLIGNGTGYTVAALTAGVGVSVTNGAGSITVATQTLKNTQTFTFGAIATNDVGDSTNTVTVTGAVVGDVVTLGLPATLPTGFTYVGYVSAADTVTIRAHGSASSGTGANAAGAAISVIVMKYASF